MQIKQRGQAIVEFALVLPLLLLVFFGIFDLGLIMTDYMALNNVARSVARELSLGKSLNQLRSEYSSYQLPSTIFVWDPNSEEYFSESDEGEKIAIKINADLNEDYAIAKTCKKLFGTDSNKVFKIEYYIYNERK